MASVHEPCEGSLDFIDNGCTARQVREASRQFVRKLELYVAHLHPTSVEKVLGKELNHVPGILLGY